MSQLFTDSQVRLAAFRWLAEQVDVHGDVLPWRSLAQGFEYRGKRVPLVSQQGIFKPRVLSEIPLSIRTSADSPYADHFGPHGLSYAYRGTDPQHRENRGLRAAMRERVPLIYFHALLRGRYLVAWPVFVVGDDPRRLMFTVALDDAQQVSADLVSGMTAADPGADGRREYITTTFRHRVHQRAFRERVLKAYRQQCSLCRLRHRELLDAAHIIPDREPEGEPVVPNGISLCKLHHAAYDNFFLTVRPDYVVEIRKDVLDEEDGPMLLHGLQGLQGQVIHKPRDRGLWPDPERLQRRYEEFRGQAT